MANPFGIPELDELPRVATEPNKFGVPPLADLNKKIETDNEDRYGIPALTELRGIKPVKEKPGFFEGLLEGGEPIKKVAESILKGYTEEVERPGYLKVTPPEKPEDIRMFGPVWGRWSNWIKQGVELGGTAFSRVFLTGPIKAAAEGATTALEEMGIVKPVSDTQRSRLVGEIETMIGLGFVGQIMAPRGGLPRSEAARAAKGQPPELPSPPKPPESGAAPPEVPRIRNENAPPSTPLSTKVETGAKLPAEPPLGGEPPKPPQPPTGIPPHLADRMKGPTPPERPPAPVLGSFDQFVQATADAWRPSYLWAKESGDFQPYRTVRLFQNPGTTIKAILEQGPARMTPSGALEFVPGIRGMGAIMRDAARQGKIADLMEFSRSVRAIELANRGKDVPLTPEQVAAGIKKGADPQLQRLYREMKTYYEYQPDLLVDTGVLSPERAQAMRDLNQAYTPFYRLAEDFIEGGEKVRGNVLAKIKGGQGTLADPMEAVYKNVASMAQVAMGNLVKTKLVEQVKAMRPDVIERLTPEAAKAEGRGMVAADPTIAQALDAAGMNKHMANVLEHAFSQKPGTVNVFENGKLVSYRIKDPSVWKQFEALNTPPASAALKMLGLPGSILRYGVTQQPIFSLITNPIRDTVIAAMQSKAVFIPVVSSAIGAVRQMALNFGRGNKFYWDLMLNGGGWGTKYRGEMTAFAKDVYRDAGFSYDKVLHTPSKILQGWENFNAFMERATRFEESANVMRRTGDIQEAAYAYREVTTDFQLRGASKVYREYAYMSAFENARTQGLYRLARAIRENPGQAVFWGVTTTTAPTLYNYFAYRNEDWYKAQPTWLKLSNWFLPFDNEKFGLFPLAHEAGFIFGGIPLAVLDSWEKQSGKRFMDMIGQIAWQSFVPNMPSFVGPAVEDIANRTFSGAPVTPAGLEKLSPYMRYTPRTSTTLVETARGLKTGETQAGLVDLGFGFSLTPEQRRDLSAILREDASIDISPMKIEHYIRGHFGTMGMLMLNTIDELSGTNKPETLWWEKPGFRQRIRGMDQGGTQFERNFYDMQTKAKQLAATIREASRQSSEIDPTPLEDTMRGLAPGMERVSDVTAKMRQAQRDIGLSKTMSPEEKRTEINKLQILINQAYRGTMREIPPEISKRYGLER